MIETSPVVRCLKIRKMAGAGLRHMPTDETDVSIWRIVINAVGILLNGVGGGDELVVTGESQNERMAFSNAQGSYCSGSGRNLACPVSESFK